MGVGTFVLAGNAILLPRKRTLVGANAGYIWTRNSSTLTFGASSSGGTNVAHSAGWMPSLLSGPARSGPITVAAGATLSGGTVNCAGGGIVLGGNGCIINAVEIYNTSGTPFTAAIDINHASNSTIRNCWFHDIGYTGIHNITDGSNGSSDNLIEECRFDNCQEDAIHLKGTNGNWNGSAWIPSAQRCRRQTVRRCVSIGHNPISGFSYELQDGQEDMVCDYNYGDATYSLVGLIGSSQHSGTGRTSIRGNWIVNPTNVYDWGFEIGNARGLDCIGNTFSGSGLHFAVVMTGNTDQQNANVTFGPDSFVSSSNNQIHVDWAAGGIIINAPDVSAGPF